jgi:hypothetical protein
MPGDVAQRPPPDQRSGGAEEEHLARINPIVQCCSSYASQRSTRKRSNGADQGFLLLLRTRSERI